MAKVTGEPDDGKLSRPVRRGADGKVPDWVTRRLPTLQAQGQRDKLFATAGLHHKLQEAGVRAGAEFTITKIEIEGNRKDWRIEGEEAPAPVATVQQGAQQQAQATGKAGSNGHARKNGHTESADFQGLKQAMQLCLNAAYGVCEGLEVDLPFTTEDVRALGITLFLECSRKGIQPQESEGLPF